MPNPIIPVTPTISRIVTTNMNFRGIVPIMPIIGDCLIVGVRESKTGTVGYDDYDDYDDCRVYNDNRDYRGL